MKRSHHDKEIVSGILLTSAEQRILLDRAREAIKRYLRKEKGAHPAEEELPMALMKHCGAFVTLRRAGRLRGCVGRFETNQTLVSVVEQMAVSAASRDLRFLPVAPEEVDDLSIEISVLTPLHRISSIDEIEIGRHGIYLKKGVRAGTYLPKVARDAGWTREEFLEHCSLEKAGLGWEGWKEAQIYIYEAIEFGESG